MLLDNSVELGRQIIVKFVIFITLLFGLNSIVDSDLLIRVVKLPGLALVLLVEVDHKKGVLEVDEEVAHVRHLLRFFLIRNDVDVPEHVLVRLVDLVSQLFLGVSARNVLDAEVRPQITSLFDTFDSDRVSLSGP